VWDLILHHCETLTDCHTHNLGSIEGVASGSVLAPDHEYPSYIEIDLTATGASGLTSSAKLDLYPRTANLTIAAEPEGLEAGFNGRPVPTPSVHEVIVGSLNTVSADERQAFDGSVFEFVDWSDGGARVHDVTVAADQTVTATYAEVEGTTIYLSSTSGGSVGGVVFRDEDLLAFETAAGTWSLAFDGSDVGIGGSDVDAAAVVSTDPFVVDLSFAGPTWVSGIGSVDDSDIVRFTGTGGTDTAGTFELLIDASDIRLATAGEDVDAWSARVDDYVFSTVGGFSALGQGGADEDAVLLEAVSTGLATDGALSLLFDGSDVGQGPEDLVGLSIGASDEMYGAMAGSWNFGGVAGDRDDVFRFDGAYGSSTSGTVELLFDGDLHGFGAEQIDAVHVGPGGGGRPPASADLTMSLTADPANVTVGEQVTFTAEVTNQGPDRAEGVVVAVDAPAGVSSTSTSGCAGDPLGLPCELGTLDVNETASFTFVASMGSAAVGQVRVTATVTSSADELTGADNSAEVLVDVAGPPVASDDGPAVGSMPGDPFHTPSDTTLVVLAGSSEDLLANDALGLPLGTILSFGGGDLGGSAADHPSGTTVGFGDGGSVSVAAGGGFAFTPESGFIGDFQFSYRLGNSAGVDEATVTVRVGQPPVVDPVFYLSSTSGGSVGGIGFADEDILAFDSSTDTWSMVFDGSDVGVGGSDVDGFAIVDTDPLVVDLSFGANRFLPGIGTVDDSDVVRFVGVGGADTSGTWSLRFDGSDVGLSLAAEDVDAVSLNGPNLALSMLGGFRMNGVSGADEDAVDLTLTQIGSETEGTGVMLFDGSAVGFSRDLVGLTVAADGGAIYGAGQGSWRVAGVAGAASDVFKLVGTFGETTSGTAEIVFDGSAHGFGAEQIDGLHVSTTG
jgi:uncharacterized repeat protein (TIGR01451 family)